jgi:hypothetical protein
MSTETAELSDLPDGFFELSFLRFIGFPPEQVYGDFPTEKEWREWSETSERL